MTALRIAALLLLACCSARPAAAQAEPPLTAGHAGGNAVLFSVNGLYLSAFNGGVGFKHWTSDRSALVASLSLDLQAEHAERSTTIVTSESDRAEVALFAGIERLLGPPARLSPYVSFSVGAGYAGYTNEGHYPGNQVPDYREQARTVSLYGRTGLGVVYRLSPRFSVSGQYHVQGAYSRSQRAVRTGEAEDEADHTRLAFTMASAALTLAVDL